ncbi:MAG: type II secretion system protein [Candidatus Jorgensenbacteria bacterium]
MRGFSLVEMIVVVAITAFLSALLLTYNRSSDNQIVLSVEREKVMGFLNRAKAFALERNLAKGGEDVCAFGVNFNKGNGTMEIFRIGSGVSGGCGDSDPSLDGTNNSVIEGLTLASRVEFRSFTCTPTTPCDAASHDVAFIPPYLKTVNSGSIVLGVKGSSNVLTVEVGVGGEITPR